VDVAYEYGLSSNYKDSLTEKKLRKKLLCSGKPELDKNKLKLLYSPKTNNYK
jgi:hypothetical protein